MRRFRWFKKLGHDVRYVSACIPYRGRRDPRRIVGQRFVWGPLLARVNRAVVRACSQHRPDLVWVDKGYTLFPRTVRQVKQITGARVVSHINDTPFTTRRSERYMWRHFREAIPLYDVHLVSQRFQIQQFLDAGAQRVLRFMHGLDPDVHRPQPAQVAPPEVEGGLLFVGNCEPDRVLIAERLLERFGLRVQVFGPHWDRFATPALRRSGALHPPIYLEPYAAAVGAAGVCLGLLSASNQDQITRRSYEVPGCGGCLLAQRTVDHQRLLREGREAFFWSDIEELLEKAQYLLEHEEVVRRVKEAAYRRSHELGFGYDQRIPRWLGFISGDRQVGDELWEETGGEVVTVDAIMREEDR